MYQGKLRLGINNDEQAAGNEAAALAELWVLADKLCIPALQDVALEAIYKEQPRTESGQAQILKYIYENTAADSPLRRYFVEVAAYFTPPDELRKYDGWLPKEMVVDIAACAMERMAHGGLELTLSILDLASYMVLED